MWDEITYPFSNGWILGKDNDNMITPTVFSLNELCDGVPSYHRN